MLPDALAVVVVMPDRVPSTMKLNAIHRIGHVTRIDRRHRARLNGGREKKMRKH